MGDSRYSYYRDRMCGMLVNQEKLLGPRLGKASRLLFTEDRLALQGQRRAEKLLRSHEHSLSIASRQLQNNLQSQAESLKHRLKHRKQRNSQSRVLKGLN